jgi:hypothetical protein
MAVGDKITAERFNQVRNKVAQVLGAGGTNPNTGSLDAQFGYGQSLASYEVDRFADVTLDDINALRSDLVKARRHQTGTDYGATGQINSDEYLGVFTNDTEIRDGDWTKYNTSADRAVVNKFSVASNSLVLETYADSPQGGSSKGGNLDTRNSSWTGILVSEVRIDFNSQREAEYFFNAGGKIEIAPRLDYSGTDFKTNKWKELLNTWVTSVRFSYNKTESFPTVGSKKREQNIGWYNLTTGYQEILIVPMDFSEYTGNTYSIQASTNAARNRLNIRVQFDDAVGDMTQTIVDERAIPYVASDPDTPVLGLLISEIRQLRPYNASSSYVRVTGPVAYIEQQGL